MENTFNNNYNNKLNIHKTVSVKCIALIMLFAMLINIVCFSNTSFAADGTRAITITKIWENDREANRPQNITVNLGKTSTMLIEGAQLNAKMKDMAMYNNTSYAIRNIYKATDEQYNAMKSRLTSNNEIQTSDSTIKAYMWYNRVNTTVNGVSFPERSLYYYSEADNIYLNPNSAKTFNLRVLENISGLAYLNTSYVTNMSQMFYECYNLSDISPISNWNVVNVTNMSQMFAGTGSSSSTSTRISSLTPLSNWDVSNVTDMSSMFEYCYNSNAFKSIAPIANWNVKCVTNLNNTFRYTRVTDGNLLTGWDSSTNSYTSDGWDVRSVANSNFNRMFGDASAKPNKAFNLRSGSWNSGTYTPTVGPITTQVSHPYTTPDPDLLTSSDSGWTKNGNVWTYTFIVNNDGSKYKTWEDANTIPSNYESSANNTTEHPAIYVENNQATITNTNQIRYITITKQWNDDGNSSARPENITLHLTKDGVTDAYVSDNNNWTKEGNTWTYVFEVSDNDNYSVWESNVDGYSTTAPQSSPISITDDSATIVNNIITYDITLIKKVTGDMAKLDDEFEVTITLYDRNNNLLSSNISIEKNGTAMQVANGSTLTWMHNDQIVVKNVVAGYKYSIAETDTDYLEHFKIEKTDDSTELVALNVGRTISNRALNQNETVTFVNNKEAVPLTMASTYMNPFVIIAVLSILSLIAIKNKKFIEDFIYKNI